MSASSCPNSRSNSPPWAYINPSRHAKGSDPVFEEVIPDDFRMLAGNGGHDTKSSRKVENIYEAQLVSSIISKHEQIYGCCVAKLSVCAQSCRQVGSRMMLTLAHIASQLQCCANCSRATSSDTHGSGKRMIRRVTRFVRSWRRLAISLRSSSAVSSCSSWSVVRDSQQQSGVSLAVRTTTKHLCALHCS